jgi:hypothetical protein
LAVPNQTSSFAGGYWLTMSVLGGKAGVAIARVEVRV